jgi:hypothetical protein
MQEDNFYSVVNGETPAPPPAADTTLAAPPRVIDIK